MSSDAVKYLTYFKFISVECVYRSIVCFLSSLSLYTIIIYSSLFNVYLKKHNFVYLIVSNVRKEN